MGRLKAVLAAMILLAANQWALGSVFVRLGDLPGGGFGSQAYGVSADGSVVVGGSLSADGIQAFRWTPEEGMVGLGFMPNQSRSFASDVSGDGSTIVGWNDSESGIRAFRWTKANGMADIAPVTGTMAHGVSSNGSVVVGSYDNSPFRWTQSGGMAVLDGGGITVSQARGVSGDGSIVVGQINDTVAFRWTEETGTIGLGYLPLQGESWGRRMSVANAVSSDGSVVVGESDVGLFGGNGGYILNGGVSVDPRRRNGKPGWLNWQCLG